jgi:hypothetical protein
MARFERDLGLHSLTEPSSMSRRAAPFAAAILLAASGCSSLASESDVLTDSATSAGPWRCFESTSNRPSAVVNPARLDYSMQVLDLATRRPPRNLKVRGCALSDITCSRPLTEATGPNADGTLVLPLILGFDGFLELTADDMGPTLYVFAGALSRELSTLMGSQPVSMLSLQALQALEASFPTPVAADAGRVVITALDCDARLSAGVRVKIAAPAVPFAVIAGLPVARQDTTDADGVVGFVNVTAGVALVSATIVNLDAALDQKTLPIRAGWTTQTILLPGPVPFD